MIRCAFAAALPEWQGEIALDLPQGATVADALELARAKIGAAADAAFWARAPVGVFGELCKRDRRLVEGDRIEIYRPLAVDPKAARRERARHAQTEKGRNPLTAKPRRGA